MLNKVKSVNRAEAAAAHKTPMIIRVPFRRGRRATRRIFTALRLHLTTSRLLPAPVAHTQRMQALLFNSTAARHTTLTVVSLVTPGASVMAHRVRALRQHTPMLLPERTRQH